MTPASKVAIVRCAAYEEASAALERAVSLLGGWQIGEGSRVLLKPNVVIGADAQRAVSTHPAVVAAAASQLIRSGSRPVVGESPGGPFHAAFVRHALRLSGIEQAATLAGAVTNDDFGVEKVDFPQGKVLRRLPLCSVALRADAIVNLCKLKTHGMMTYTGAVKNLFGLVPGTHKVEMHARFPQTERFAAMINDVALCVGPALHVMDAVVGMEGEGPSHGRPKHVGALLVSRDPFALDHVASGMIGLAASDVPTLADAMERGLYDAAAIELLGDDPAQFACVFELPVSKGVSRLSRRGIVGAVSDVKPKVNAKACVGCGICEKACPAKAIAMERGRPKVAYRTCIRCYCCQELCPHGAMKVRKSFLGRFVR